MSGVFIPRHMSESKKNTDWNAIEGEYRSGIDPLRTIAERHGITEGAIRAKAKKYGWTRDPAKTKRSIVEAAMSGVAQGVTQETTQRVMEQIAEAANLDIADMERGLRINRTALINLERVVDKTVEPKEIKIVVEATSAAIESIRRIRGLQEPSIPPAVVPTVVPVSVEDYKRAREELLGDV